MKILLVYFAYSIVYNIYCIFQTILAYSKRTQIALLLLYQIKECGLQLELDQSGDDSIT